MAKNSARRLIIKKYENRRLYNTVTSQYINQEQVAQLVRDGHDVQVLDAATGEDLTRFILAQIVLEDAKTPDSVFPLDMLRQMILASGRATQENALRYMKSMMDIYQNAYRSLPATMNPFEILQGRWAQPPSGTEERVTGQVPPEREAKANSSDVDELKRRIEELEALLTSKASKKTVKQKARSRRKS
jgi:polyhydroxyalkanoate synthesis repressor PhaR